MADDAEEIAQITFKFIIVGNTNVGKSCLLLRYVKNQFKYSHAPTIGMQFFSKRVLLDDIMVKMQIWDTAGQQTFKSIVRNFYKNTNAIFLVYSIAERASFDAIDEWFQQATTHSPQAAICILIGNQKDLQDQRKVSYSQGQELMKKHKMAFFFQTSAKEDDNVDLAFEQTAKLIMVKKLMAEDTQQDTIRLSDLSETQREDSSCC